MLYIDFLIEIKKIIVLINIIRRYYICQGLFNYVIYCLM